MNTSRLRQLAFFAAAILFTSQPYYGRKNEIQASFPNEPAWVTFAPEGEEFTVTTPAWPTVRTYPVGTSHNPDHEKVLAHREFGGYGGGVVFVIQSYKAARPERLWSDVLKFTDQSATFERDVVFDGITAKQYRDTYSNRSATYVKHILRFATKEHVYLVTLATLEEINPAVDRFLSSFRLRRADDPSKPYGQSSEFVLGQAFNPNEVTRRAIIVSKGEPFYTAQARAHQVVGTVKLEAIFAADGYVANITVTQGLKDGLTEAAIEAARNIRFFPAEKDGKPVSQVLKLEYNFNVY
jgi:TonB family protein